MPKSKSKSKSKGKASTKSKKEVEKEEKIEKHPGYSCLYLGDKELQGYGFKTGDGLLDVSPFRTLKKEDIIEEIQFKGKMCAFHPFRQVIEKYEESDILFVWDPDEEKEAECNFYFCNTLETFNIQKEKLGISEDGLAMDPEELKRKKQLEEEEEKRKEAEEEKKREEERICKAINELKKPIIARKWNDLGSFNEIINNKIHANRIRNRISISRKRREFGKSIQFSDQENMEAMNIEIKSSQTGSTKYGYDIYKKLTDKNNQIGGEMINESTQTKWNRKINKIVQYEFNQESIKTTNTDGIQTDNNMLQMQTISDNPYIIGFYENSKTEKQKQDEKQEEIINLNEDEDGEDADEKLLNFLEDVYGEIEEVLTDNNLVNIFEDDFKLFVDNERENGLDAKTENIKEMQTFVDLNWSRGKKISNIEWMPSQTNKNKNMNMVAVSCIENMSFDERVNIMNKSRISTILLWNLSHILLKAQTILTAPSDIFTFKFHPQNENIIIGGLETGQVVLWDLNDWNHQKKNSKHHKNNNKDKDDVDDPTNIINNSDTIDDFEDEKIPQIEPKMLSYIEKSHSKSVSDILWLPSDIMMINNGELQYINTKNRPKGTKMLNEEQFISIAGDGSMLVWDIMIPKQTEKEKKKKEPAKWIPIFSKKLCKKNLNENVFVDKEAMDLANYDKENEENENENENKENENESSSDTIFGCKMCYTPLLGKMCITTELGEFCLFNYGKINKEFVRERDSLLLCGLNNITSSTYLLSKTEENENKENNNCEILQLQNSILSINSHIYKQHFLDIKSISISPHFSDIYLTIGDWRFCIWRNNKLIFISPYCSSYICCGCWSPTRPSVVITAKYDGTLDIWDLLDQTHCAVIKNSPISSTSITSIIFSQTSTHQLAVGDSNGNLRILQIPRNFVIPLNNEKLLMAQFYQKEYIRIQFINKRYNLHKEKKLQMEKEEKEKENQEKENQEKKENENDEQQNQKQIDETIESKYQNMLVAFKKQLGIKNK